MTWLLVVAGALVTSNDAGGAIPDWPLSWGRLVPPLEGGIVYAYGHRVLAAVVLALTFIMGLKLGAWLPFILVSVQAVLGALTVLLVLPKVTVLIHACLGQILVGRVVSPHADWRSALLVPTPQALAVAALLGQTVLGAAVRHQLVGPVPHIVGAAVASLIVLWAVVPVMMDHMREAGALLALTAFQIFLGMGAYFSRTIDAPQPMPMMIGLTAAHVAVGSMAFGAAVLLALSQRRQSQHVSGGMAVA
jgi:cytochrome c oxidase assembly protein subunit 15